MEKNITNEIVILNSYSINEKVIEELQLGLSYFQHGFFQTNELFDNSPFIVKIDSSHHQLTETEFKLTIVDENRFRLQVSTKDKFAYNLKAQKFDKSKIANVNTDEIYQFNQKINSEYYSFKIFKSLNFNKDIINNSKTYSFKLNRTDKLAQNLISSVSIKPINKETSILKLNIQAKNPKKY